MEFTKQAEPKPTWRAIVAALRNPVVNLPQLAIRIEAKHCPNSNATHATPSKTTHISEIASGSQCRSRISDAAAAHNGMAYFAKGYDIYEFDVSRRYWTRMIPCQQAYFGMAVIEDQLTLIGGVIKSEETEGLEVATNKVVCWSLSASSKQQSWHEKYPALGTARICPEIVVAGKYLIALGGWTGLINKKRHKPTGSVELLDLEEKRWYSNDRICLPQVFTTMIWQSACICNNDLFIALEHEDPNFEETMSTFIDEHDEYDAEYAENTITVTDKFGDEYRYAQVHYEMLDPPNPYPCFSMYRCSVETLLHISQENEANCGYKDKKEDKSNCDYIWQSLSHPHPSVFKLSPSPSPPPMGFTGDKDFDSDNEVSSRYYHYGICCFTLSCINNHTLIAVGCDHVESITDVNLQPSLYTAYSDYRSIKALLHEVGNSHYNIQHYDDDASIEKCHVYLYDLKKDSWKCLDSIPENGSPNYQPSVAVVDNKIVIMRNSDTVHICTIN